MGLKKISPMLASLVKKPFDKEGWLFEIKWDGYRALASKNKKVELLSRGGKAYNTRFPELVKDLQKLPGRFIVDGEIVILDKKGRSDFQLLQNYQRDKEGTPIFYLFDILYWNGKDLTKMPLIKRKEILEGLLQEADLSSLRFSGHIQEKGKAFFREAVKLGLEGIMAKKEDSKYLFQRSRNWLKIKASFRQEAVIGGFTEPKGGRLFFGSLLVGVYENGKLVYAGRVGMGFDQKMLREVHKLLVTQKSSICPFSKKPKESGFVTWVKPKIVCEVSFREWTKEGIMRQPVFLGLREDKPPKKVLREIPL